VARPLLDLIDGAQVVINDLILAELLPSIKCKKELELGKLLSSLESIPLDIDWREIIEIQTKNLKNGHNNVGIADLIIAQNAFQNGLLLFENDKHFLPLITTTKLRLFRGDRVGL
jgi:predicted nucleic acid-binding protein